MYDRAVDDRPAEPSAPGERSSIDEILDLYRRDVDLTLLRENLRLTPEERSRKFEAFMASLEEIRGAARRA